MTNKLYESHTRMTNIGNKISMKAAIQEKLGLIAGVRGTDPWEGKGAM